MEAETREEIMKQSNALLEQIELFTMKLELEKAQTAFRETYDAWYAKRITLMDSINAMMDNMRLCRRIGVWRGNAL